MTLCRLTWPQLLDLDGSLHLPRQLDHRFDLLGRLLALLQLFLERRVHRMLTREEVVQELLTNREASLDGLLSSPVLPMSLALDL